VYVIQRKHKASEHANMCCFLHIIVISLHLSDFFHWRTEPLWQIIPPSIHVQMWRYKLDKIKIKINK
jgi:hypothetical protein